MYLRIDPTAKSRGYLGINLITIKFESGNCKGSSLGDISPYPDNVSFEVVSVSYEGCRGLSYHCHSGKRPGWRDLDPFTGLEYYPIFRGKTSCRTENLFLTKFIVDIHRPICIPRTHLIDGRDIEGIFHRYLQIYRSYIDRIFTVEDTGFFLCEDDISRYCFDSELWRYRHIGF